jgi:exopolysaccharide biosynthesis polyprenyl glycosylphosphotransferase
VLKYDSLTYLRFFLIDICLTLVALCLAKLLREIVPLGVYLDEPLRFSPWLYLIVPLIWLVVFMALRVYSPARALRYTEDLPTVWGAIIGASFILTGVAYLLFRELSRFLVFYFIILDLIFLNGWRWLLPHFPALAQHLYGGRRRRVLIVGAGPIGQELARAITTNPATDLSLIGFANDRPEKELQALTGYPVLGGFDDVPRLVQEHRVQEIIFVLPPAQQAILRSLVMALQNIPANLRLVPDVFDLVFLRASAEEFEGIPLIGLREPAIQGLDRFIKRLFDLIASFLLLTILSPLMLGIALLIKLDSNGPILFRQRRVGEGGRLFWIYKFRSMVDGAEEEETQLLQRTADGQPLFAKNLADLRVTRVGRFLRRTSLDELPQLLNVLKGEMSLVGPRPELPWLVEQYQPWQRKRFAVPQGMTGWWQINGRMQRPELKQRVEDDLFYIRNYSLWLDVRILWKTIRVVFSGEGAY